MPRGVRTPARGAAAAPARLASRVCEAVGLKPLCSGGGAAKLYGGTGGTELPGVPTRSGGQRSGSGAGERLVRGDGKPPGRAEDPRALGVSGGSMGGAGG